MFVFKFMYSLTVDFFHFEFSFGRRRRGRVAPMAGAQAGRAGRRTRVQNWRAVEAAAPPDR